MNPLQSLYWCSNNMNPTEIYYRDINGTLFLIVELFMFAFYKVMQIQYKMDKNHLI